MKQEPTIGMYITVETPDGHQRLVMSNIFITNSSLMMLQIRRVFGLPTRLFYSNGMLATSIGVVSMGIVDIVGIDGFYWSKDKAQLPDLSNQVKTTNLWNYAVDLAINPAIMADICELEAEVTIGDRVQFSVVPTGLQSDSTGTICEITKDHFFVEVPGTGYLRFLKDNKWNITGEWQRK